jgi:D-3-phosphoglycerate dehydrogenase
MKVVVAEKISSSAVELLRAETRWSVITADQLDGDLPAALESADALIVRSAVTVNAALLAHANRLRVIGRAGVGVDNIDLDTATRKGIAVMNTPGANSVAVAEQTLAMMLAMARHLSRANELTHAGRWEKKSLQGSELKGKTLGIVGLGRIGMEVARRARAFGMSLIGHDPFVSTSVAREQGIRLAALDEIFSESDYLTLHVGLTPQTTGMINSASLKKMKRGIRLVNCARGELINEEALAEALKSGHVAAAALDVFQQEPPKDSPLLKLETLIATPHIAGSTYEAQEAVGYQIALQVKEYLKHGVIQNAVNVPSVSADEYAAMQPYIMLGEKLGSFLAQICEGKLQELSLRYSGELAEWKTELVRNAIIRGVLNQTVSDSANLVNAASIAESCGISVHEGRKPRSAGGAGNVISVLLKTAKEEHLVRGTVLHSHSARLLGIDSIDIEGPLERNLIYLRNRDVPGVIGRIGTILGAHKVNIADFSLGRSSEATKKSTISKRAAGAAETRVAIAVVHVDTRVSEEVLKELRRIPAVHSAKAIHL